jgi:hypothetical protein
VCFQNQLSPVCLLTITATSAEPQAAAYALRLQSGLTHVCCMCARQVHSTARQPPHSHDTYQAALQPLGPPWQLCCLLMLLPAGSEHLHSRAGRAHTASCWRTVQGRTASASLPSPPKKNQLGTVPKCFFFFFWWPAIMQWVCGQCVR